MSESYTNLLYHIVFATKDRRPLITEAHQSRLYDYTGDTIRGLGGISLEVNGTEDHGASSEDLFSRRIDPVLKSEWN